MRRVKFAILVALLVLAIAKAAQAQTTGCVDSPEDPTVIFGLIAAASFGIMRLRNRTGSREK